MTERPRREFRHGLRATMYFKARTRNFHPPFHLTAEDVTTELGTHRVTPCKITKHSLDGGGGLGGTLAVQFLTHWESLVRTTLTGT